jgi:hypothetical protein
VSETLFCKKCHAFICRYKQGKDGTEILKNDNPAGAKMFGMTFEINGKKYQGTPAQCSRGHFNFIPDTQEMIDEAIRLNHNYGQPCHWHYNPGAVCNQKKSCEDCIVKKDYSQTVIETRRVNGMLNQIAEDKRVEITPIIPDLSKR